MTDVKSDTVERRYRAAPAESWRVLKFGGSSVATAAGWRRVAEALRQALEYARFLPLLMPSEAFITGMLMSILLVYHPGWVATFNDHRYIDTK